MREIICKRCGRPNQVSEEILQLPKCPQCENIKFAKDFFSPIAEQVQENFTRAKETEYGKILKRLYFFGHACMHFKNDYDELKFALEH